MRNALVINRIRVVVRLRVQERVSKMEDIKEKIRAFFAQKFDGMYLQDDQDIIDLGFFSSLLAAQLIVFVENTFDVTITREDLDTSNFRTINAMVNLIKRKHSIQQMIKLSR